MPRPTVPCLATVLLAVSAGYSLETASYVNDAAALPVGARTAGMGGVSIGAAGDPSHLSLSPAGLADIPHPEVVFHHASLYEDLSLSQDELFVAVPLSYGTVGLGVARVGADGILRSSGGQAHDFAADSTFGATDWIASVAFARTWFEKHLRAGVALRLLGRDIDGYYGGGTQLDASAIWYQDGLRVGLRLDRGIGGLATWESGRTEYAPPDLVPGIGYERRLPYFYGQGTIAWEGAGLLQKQSASTFSSDDARPWVDPWLYLRSSRIAAEFKFDMGLVLRTGCEIQSVTRAFDFLQGEDQQGQFGESKGSVSVGAGYLWANRVRFDYALVAHPDLGTTQRFSAGIVFGGIAPKPAPEHPDAHEPEPRHEPTESDTIAAPEGDPVAAPILPDSGLAAPSASDSALPARPSSSPDTTAPATASQPAAPLPEPPKAAVPAKPALPDDEWDAPEQAAP